MSLPPSDDATHVSRNNDHELEILATFVVKPSPVFPPLLSVRCFSLPWTSMIISYSQMDTLNDWFLLRNPEFLGHETLFVFRWGDNVQILVGRVVSCWF